MNQRLATIVYVAFIAGLFYMDRDTKVRTSKALWISVLWLMIVGSRPISTWFDMGPTISQGPVGTEGSPLDAAIFAILIVAALVAIGMRWEKVVSFVRGNIPIVLYFIYAGLSIAWCDYPVVAAKRWVKAVADFIMIVIVLTDPEPIIAIKRYLARVGYILLTVSVLFIKYYPDLGRAYNPWTWEPTYCGVTTFKNELGMICLVCALGALWLFMRALGDRKMDHRMLHMIATGTIVCMSVWLFITADSMTSFTCFLMAGTVIVITSRKAVASNYKIIHLLVWSFVALSLFALFGDSGGGMVHSLGRNPTLTGRTAIWQAVLSLHTNPIIGTGFENFWLGSRMERIWDITAQHIQEAHDGYLEVYLNLGFVGIALLASMIVSGYRNVFSVYRRNADAGRIRLALFTAGIIYSVTEAGFRMMSPIWIGFLFAITYVPPGFEQPKKNRSRKKLDRRVTPLSKNIKSERLIPELVEP